MKKLHANDIEIFTSKYNDKNLNIIFTQKSLWLSKMDICSLFKINEQRFDYELMKIFSDGIFSRQGNRGRFQVGERTRVIEFFRLGIIISLGYRIKANKGTKYIIHTNRIIKTRLSKDRENIEKSVYRKSVNNDFQEKGINTLNKVLVLLHSFGKQGIHKIFRV